MPTVTPNIGLYKPLVNDPTDQDLWGGYLNTNADTLDALLAGAAYVPTGSSILFNGTTAPSGFIAEDGSLISRTTYAVLWTFAQASGNLAANDGVWDKGMFSPGDGSTTFRIPDSRGYFVRGWDNGAGVDTGRAFGSSQSDQFQTHTHALSDPGHFHTSSFNSPSLAGGGISGAGPSTGGFNKQTDTDVTNIVIGAPNTGKTGTETRPLNIAKLWCIKT